MRRADLDTRLNFFAVDDNFFRGARSLLNMRLRHAELSFEDFVRARSSSLLRTALLLTGQNRAEAEDLLQLALERAYRHWPRVCRIDEPERYVRRIIANASADRWRKIARRAEQVIPATYPDLAIPDHTARFAEHDYLLRALAALPPGQRAVLVLRYFDDLSEGETAQMLGCSVGTVKSQAARALARLRSTVVPAVNGRQPAKRAVRLQQERVSEVGVDG